MPRTVGGSPMSSRAQQLRGNLPQNHAEIPLFLEHAHAEARQFAEGKAEIRPAALADVLDVVLPR